MRNFGRDNISLFITLARQLSKAMGQNSPSLFRCPPAKVRGVGQDAYLKQRAKRVVSGLVNLCIMLLAKNILLN